MFELRFREPPETQNRKAKYACMYIGMYDINSMFDAGICGLKRVIKEREREKDIYIQYKIFGNKRECKISL
jgi:hypothetical protein